MWFFVTHSNLSSSHFSCYQYSINAAYSITFQLFFDKPYKNTVCQEIFVVSLSQSTLFLQDEDFQHGSK
ncbi:hypothetical protein MJO28_011264 [Puccinia striiformis f. sp. tritici]|uniref:Uncharacterized protein n=1 Tax=Puccinia striiformis f. sp. tritici TaxID=168172 RepID=A0ACC0E276_9BASI|nr:hypothetical protein MJO28_011264 [Puccinia striiformis f. sp. tritici]